MSLAVKQVVFEFIRQKSWLTPREWGLYKNLNSLLKLFLSYLKRLFPLSDYHLSPHYQEYTHLRITYPLNTLKTNYIIINSSTYSIPNAITDTMLCYYLLCCITNAMLQSLILLKSQMPSIFILLNYFAIMFTPPSDFWVPFALTY